MRDRTDASCRCRSKQRDSAGRLGSEVRITYPHHPRCGQAVAVLGSKRHAGSSHFVVRQPDGTLSLLPSWMTESAASANRMHLSPRLPIERLVDLRCLVDALLASLQGESVPGERVHDACSEAKSARSVQATVARAQLHPAVRAKLEPLLRSLLTEAACVQPRQTAISANEQEGGDDQDHA